MPVFPICLRATGEGLLWRQVGTGGSGALPTLTFRRRSSAAVHHDESAADGAFSTFAELEGKSAMILSPFFS